MEPPAPTQPPLPSDAHDKLKAIRLLEETGSTTSTISSMFHDLAPAYYDSRHKLILGWRNRREQIEASCSSRSAMQKKARPQGHTTALPQGAEKELLLWVNELQEEGVPVSTSMLRLEAIEIGEDHGVTEFAASWSWRK